MEEYKTCSKCGRTLEVTKNFYKKGKGKEGYRPQCKDCINEWQLKYYKDNKEDRVAYQLKYERNKRKINKKYEFTKEEKREILKKVNKKYYEGVKKTVISKKTVRNNQLRDDYIEYLKNKQNGKIWCEICGQWEEIGEDMLQVHHLIEINGYEKENKEYSTFDDVIAICPNCHRLIHIFENIEDVKKIYNKED